MQVPLIGNSYPESCREWDSGKRAAEELGKDDVKWTTYNPSQLAKEVIRYAVYKNCVENKKVLICLK